MSTSGEGLMMALQLQLQTPIALNPLAQST
jgi:hypothetical protein